MKILSTSEFSITSDYATSTGEPQPYLERIADAGFRYLHWCHHWNTDFLYDPSEIAQISRWLGEYGLKMLNIHASEGVEKRWDSLHEYERLAGIDLVRNRLEMAAYLDADVIILHAAPYYPLVSQLRSLAALEPYSRDLGVRIALENLGELTYQRLDELFGAFSPDFLGLCYDTGHGAMIEGSLDQLARYADRLIALHIHDNNGSEDEHKLPFTGTVDWSRFVQILTGSVYDKPLNLEVGIGNHSEMTEKSFLEAAYRAAAHLAAMCVP